jgi:hypothetical protein
MVGRADLSSSDKGKTCAEFEQEPFKVPDQPCFQFPLPERFVQGQEIKDIGIFQGILGELRMRLRPANVSGNWATGCCPISNSPGYSR